MGWGEWFAKGQERRARSARMVGITRSLMLGGVLAAAGGWSMYSDTVHQLHGKPATATLIEHIKECTVEYQRVGESRRKEPMDCDTAEAFQRFIGSNKVKLSHDSFARIGFSLEDGSGSVAKVEESKLGSYKLPVGATLAVVYAPDNPADVRAVLTWERFKVSLIIFAVGLVFLMLPFIGRLAALFAWAFRGRTSAAEDGLASLPGLDRAIARMASEGRGKIAKGPAVAETGRMALRSMGSAPRASFGMRR